MSANDLARPELYINRELSWLAFNDRVLRQGARADVPLLERLKFLGIVSSNLDEFFMIRFAGLKRQMDSGVEKRDPSGMTPAQQVDAIRQRVRRMMAEQSAAITAVLAELDGQGVHVLEDGRLSAAQRQFLATHFQQQIEPLLVPLAVDEMATPPILPGQRLGLAVLLSCGQNSDEQPDSRLAIVPMPAALGRFITLPAEGGLQLVRIEDICAANAVKLFPGYKMIASAVFRLNRDADVEVGDEDAADLLSAMMDAVHQRGRRDVVRLNVSAGADPRLLQRLTDLLGVEADDVCEIAGMLDAASLMEIANRPGLDAFKDPPWPPQPPADLRSGQDLFETLKERDVLLFHPYESFDPVVQLIEQAAADPGVMAIKQTLYRTSGDSPIVRALARAAEAGKQVCVLVELKARFDEQKNVNWAQRLEEAGCYVIYGVAGLKTHAKALLIIRREAHGIRRYLHMSTGNYNDRTARLYSDIGLMTTDVDLTADAAAFFNLLTGYSQSVGWNKFAIAPTGLRQRFIDLIEREIEVSTPDRPGRIVAKINSLQDTGICQALYRASQAGVQVRLNVRGLCCLRPGVKGVSENIEVVSVVDRFLEHSRIFYFNNGGHEEVYLSSADWMERNLSRRLEILFPVQQEDLQRRLIGILETFLADNVKAMRLRSDGEYEPVPRSEPAVRSQEEFYRQAVEASAAAASMLQFRPLARPE